MDSVKAGTARSVMVVAAEERVPQPRSDFDDNVGDGAAAFIVSGEGVVAAIEDIYSYSHEIYDVWRTDTDVFPRSAEDRFVADEGYVRAMKESIATMMQRRKLATKDITSLVAYAPSPRRHTEICRALGFDEKGQLAESFLGQVGDTGCAFVPMMLAGALELAKAGDLLLAVSYGEGSDALLLKVVSNAPSGKKLSGLRAHVASKKTVQSYLSYLRWRGLVSIAPAAKRPPLKIPGVQAIYREIPRNIMLYGVRCRSCGTVQYPDERVCTQCQAQGSMEPWKLSKKGSLFSFSQDYLGPTPDPPLVVAVVDFEGGGRGIFSMTDRDTNEIKVGMPVEMSFRRLHTVEGVHNYYWCATPQRLS